MNAKQFFDQIKVKLKAQVWGVSVNKVFNQDSVLVSVAVPAEALRNLIPPLAIVKPGASTSDPEHDEEPDLIMQKFAVTLVTFQNNDTYGEGCLLGSNVADANKSEGKGIFQVEEELFNAIQELDTDDSIKIYCRAKSAPDAILDEGMYIAWREYEFEALITASQS